MVDTPYFKALRSVLPDTLVGLGVFAATLVLTMGDASVAAPYSASGFNGAGHLVPGLGDQGVFFLLAASFAVIVTLDLAFVRHVVRTYSGPRRKSGRCRDRKIALLARDNEL